MVEQLGQFWASLLSLGARRLAALAAAGLTIFTAIGFGSYYVNRPELDVLYVGLTSVDVSRIGAALKEAGIAFDVNAEGTKVLVKRGDTASARMLLAEKGLPASGGAGYELFDKLGSMSLTSFMQNVTRVRALEGEIARTVQAMKGVKAARVHLVLPDLGSFRRNAQPPSASVVIRTENTSFGGTNAIRHLVAAAVPSMTFDQVSILTTDGAVLAAAGEQTNAAPVKMLDLEKEVSKDIAENIRRTLVPFLGLENFELSVTARLNTDKRQTSETAFDPESRVERSVRTVKETSNSQNAGNKWSVSVEQNIPNDQAGGKAGEQSKKSNERKEELTNYEVNSKVVATTSDGYRIEQLAVAVVVNRKRLTDATGGNSTADALSNQVREVERLVTSAAAIDAKRGDKITVAAVDFAGSGQSLDPVASPGLLDRIWAQSGSLINAAAFLLGTVLVIWLAVRPALRLILEHKQQEAILLAATAQALPALDAPAPLQEVLSSASLPGLPRNTVQEKLAKLVDQHEEQAAAVLKDWIRSGT